MTLRFYEKPQQDEVKEVIGQNMKNYCLDEGYRQHVAGLLKTRSLLSRRQMKMVVKKPSTDPESCLEELVKRGFPNGGFIFLNEDVTRAYGADEGGITKQFVTELCEALVKKGKLELGVNSLPKTSGSEDSLTILHNYGILLSQLFEKNDKSSQSTRARGKPVTGQIFSEQFFTIMQINERLDLSQQDKDLAIRDIVAKGDPHIALLAEFLQTPSEEKKASVYEILRIMSDEEIEVSLDDIASLQALCKGFFDAYTNAAKAVYEGLSPILKQKVVAQGSKLSKQLQGESIDVDRLIGCILHSSYDGEKFAQRTRWLADKIRSEAQDPQLTWVKAFLFYVTGQKVMNSDFSMEVVPSRFELCCAHTCFNQIEIPMSDEAPYVDPNNELTPEERFIKSVEYAINMSGINFDGS